MRILFLAPRMPLPADTGGKIRTFNLIKQIIRNHTMDLACFSFEKDDQAYANELERLGVKVTLVPVGEPSLFKKIRLVLFSSAPYSAAKYCAGAMEEAIKVFLSKNAYDIVHVDHIHMAHYGHLLDGIPCLVDEHNVEYRILERCADVETSRIKKEVFRGQARKMKRFEKGVIHGLSACSAVSDEDGRILRNLTGDAKPVYTLPNGVDTQYFKGTSTQDQEDAVVFTGSMDWFPNDDAAVYFCEDILPLIWKERPEVKFYIVGKAPSQRLKELSNGEPRIVITGRVDDVRVFVNRSKVFVVPLRIGGGTRLKILEAMSMEKAVVSTTIGAEGIGHTGDINIVLADKPAAFAQKVVSLIDDGERRRSLGEAGRKLVLEKYDWNIVGEELCNVYEQTKNKN